jgi:hypothetical protein
MAVSRLNPLKQVLSYCMLGLIVLGAISLMKLAWYETAGASNVRAAVGQSVRLNLPANSPAGYTCGTFQGTLIDTHYRTNGVWGFFELYININGNPSISTGLRPSDLERIIVE